MAAAKAVPLAPSIGNRMHSEIGDPFMSRSIKCKRRADATFDGGFESSYAKRGRFGELFASAHGDCPPFPGSSSASSPFGEGMFPVI